MSLTGSIVILIVCLARKLLGRAPKFFSYMLWSVVLFRLLCPVSIEFPVSIIPENIHNGVVVREFTDTYIGDTEFFSNETQEYAIAIEHGIEPTISYDETGKINSYVVTAKDGVSKPSTIYNTVLPSLSNIWLIGIIILLFYNVIMLFKLHKKLFGATPIDDGIYIADYIDTPFVMGIFQPKIFLPSSLSKREMEYIIMHEQHHIKRHDYIIKILAFAALCIHWFNPLVWLAFILSGKDMEMSCDEAVLKKMGEEIKNDYSASLLSLATGRRIIAGTPLAFGEGDTKSRIKNTLRWKKPAMWLIVVATIICLVIGIFCLVNPKDTKVNSPYEWTNSVTAEDITFCSATICDEETTHIAIHENEKLFADLIYILNELKPYSIEESENKISETYQVSIMIKCSNQQYLLVYNDGITQISLNNNIAESSDIGLWQTSDKQLSNFMKKLLSQAKVEKAELEKAYIPSVQEVTAMREKVLMGMTDDEISHLRELVKVENQGMEWDYIEGNYFWNLQDPESIRWNSYSLSGDVLVGWNQKSDLDKEVEWDIKKGIPLYDQDSGLSEEDYFNTIAVPIIEENHTAYKDVFRNKVLRWKNMLKTDLLDADFDTLIQYMDLAAETHDVHYLYQVYYILHDLDYFLLRYGPVDVGIYTTDDSTVEKYYGVLQVYGNPSNTIKSNEPLIVKRYPESTSADVEEYIWHTYYEMSDGTWKSGEYTYKYKLVLTGRTPNAVKDTTFTILSNTEDITYEQAWKASGLSSNMDDYFKPEEALFISFQ